MRSKLAFLVVLFSFFFTVQYSQATINNASIFSGEFPSVIDEDSSKNVILVVLQDVLGEIVYSKVLVTGNNETFHFATDPQKNIAPGTYMIVASADNDLYFRKMVIQ